MKIGRVQLQLRHLMLADAIVFVAAGAWFAFVATPDAQPYNMTNYGQPLTDEFAVPIQTLGIVLAGLGLMFWLLHGMPEATRRGVTGPLFAFFALWSVIMLGQQQSIHWDDWASGPALPGMYALLFVPIISAVGFGAFFFAGSRNDVKMPDDAAALAKAGDPANGEQP